MGVKISELTEMATFDEAGEVAIEIASETQRVQGGRFLAGNYGSYTVWDDLRAPATAFSKGGVNDPGFAKLLDDGAGSTGLYTYLFDESAEEELFFIAQLPHAYKYGTDLRPHVHWVPTDTDTGDVVWGLEYSLAEQDGTFGDSSIVTVTDAADGTADKHQLASFAHIDGSAIDSLAAMLIVRIFRDAGNEADTYAADAALLEFDIHYQIDQAGSHEEFVK